MLVNRNKVIYADLSFKINGILFRVHRDLGIYKSERQFCDGIEELLKQQKIAYEREKILPPSFCAEMKGRNKVDFLIEGKIILEIKTKPFITKEDYYQVRRYLDALNVKLGIIVNMRRYAINPKRILNSRTTVSNFA